MESTFELFSIGVGPSSSHTVGPMKAGFSFVNMLTDDELSKVTRAKIDLYGSLALTGKGHKTDYAAILGLMGFSPESIDIDLAQDLYDACIKSHEILLNQKYKINFNYEADLIFNTKIFLPEHANGMKFTVYANDNEIASKEYFSIGGGFILDKKQMRKDELPIEEAFADKPYIFKTAVEMMNLCGKENKTIAELMFENEKHVFGEELTIHKLNEIWQVMEESIHKGLEIGSETLPGGLNVRRRAKRMVTKLDSLNTPKDDFNYLNAYAIAVNEQNACGRKVVTAPTNGAAGVIPAVLKYYLEVNNITDKSQKLEIIKTYLFTCAAIGILYKSGASISAAEVGCQGEIGVACSMAAAGYCALLGGDVSSIESAAEIGMEHNLGLTCDPIMGLVQIPCIERNAMGAVQAINAAKMAHLDSGEKHIVGLDYVIKAMMETGRDMNSKYKETSLGGLAINVPVC